MSVLDQFEVVPVSERAQGYDPVRIRRKKLATALQEQLNLLLAGGGYQRVHVERRRDLETDELLEVSQRRRVVPWWSHDDAGQVRFTLRYGSVPLKIRGDDSVVLLPTLAALQDLIPNLRQGVLRGELDGPLAAAADELTARFKRQPTGVKRRA